MTLKAVRPPVVRIALMATRKLPFRHRLSEACKLRTGLSDDSIADGAATTSRGESRCQLP